MTQALPERTFRIWKVLDKSFSRYHDLLQSRQKLITETGELHNQNEELKNLLNQYIRINHELIIPPTKLMDKEAWSHSTTINLITHSTCFIFLCGISRCFQNCWTFNESKIVGTNLADRDARNSTLTRSRCLDSYISVRSTTTTNHAWTFLHYHWYTA